MKCMGVKRIKKLKASKVEWNRQGYKALLIIDKKKTVHNSFCQAYEHSALIF